MARFVEQVLDFSHGRAINLPTPTASGEAAPKAYVDVTTQTVTTSSTLSETGQTHVLCNTASTITITLMAVSTRTKTLTLKNIGTGTTTIVPGGTATIDGLTTITLRKKDSMTLFSDGSNWWIS